MTARKNIMLGTAGHVDHGKTALVKLLTGCDTDRLPEEKARGMTIELGFAPCRLRDSRVVGIVDVPGHVDFIRNMAAGAHGLDVVILVVAADDGVMPQTREHLDILTLLGVRRGLVALTKIDLVNSDLRQLALEDVRGFLRGTFLEDAPVCPVSNLTGAGLEGFFEALNDVVALCPDRQVTGLFRLWIERTFVMPGFGSIVSGIPTSGQVRAGQRLTIQPGGQTGRVRRLEVYGEQADVGRAGECVALNFTDADPELLKRGLVLCDGEAFAPVEMAEAEVSILPSVPAPVKDYTEVHLHVGTGEVMARLALLEDKVAAPGSSQMVQLRLARALSLATGERFVIRAGLPGLAQGRLTTIGGGRILSCGNVRLRRGRSWTIEHLRARRSAIDSPLAWCELNLKEHARPLDAGGLARRADMTLEQVEPLLAALRESGAAADAGGGQVVHRDPAATAQRQILDALEQFGAANPLRAGMERAELEARLKLDQALLDFAAGRLVAAGRLLRQGAVLALPGHVSQLSPADAQLCARVEDRLRAAHLAPPSPAELARELAVPPALVEAMLRLLADRQAVIRLDDKLAMHRQAVQAARQVVLNLFAKAEAFETVDFRDALGVSRKFAVPLLDYFDRVRLTVRSGSRRTPGRANSE